MNDHRAKRVLPENEIHRAVGDKIVPLLYEAPVQGALEKNDARTLESINDALTRHELGTYGVCEGCKQDIPASRLTAQPFATKCCNCKREEEEEIAASSQRPIPARARA